MTGIDVIIPVSPSNRTRNFQPVILIAEKLAKLFNKDLILDILISTNNEK